MPSGHEIGNLAGGVRFMEVNATFNIQLTGCELPDGPIQLVGHESSSNHGLQKIFPCNLSLLICGGWDEEDCSEHLIHKLRHAKCRLLIR
jgi:hypothetical protein